MSRRNIIIIIAAVIALVLIIILVWWLFFLRRPQPAPANPSAIEVPVTLPQASSGLANESQSPVFEPALESSLKAMALTFAERFGSYSNQSNFSNLDALRDLMTVRMKIWADSYQASQAGIEDAAYYGVTTQALSAQITAFEESLGQAEIVVTTQRQEAKVSTVNPRVFYQDLKLQLVKTGEGWKVDSAEWQE